METSRIKYKSLFFPGLLTLLVLGLGLAFSRGVNPDLLLQRLVLPLLRLLLFIGLGLILGQVVEATGWTRRLAVLAGPLFRFGNLGQRCSAAFTTGFVSGTAANSMLLDFYKENKISKLQLFLTNFVNQLPAYFLHLPTTFFIVVPLTGRAGLIYFGLTLAATLLRVFAVLVFGHFSPGLQARTGRDRLQSRPEAKQWTWPEVLKRVKNRLPARLTSIARIVVPVYSLVYVANALGFFQAANAWVSDYLLHTFMPVESLSVVVLSFAAEFTSGFAAAGALLEAGALSLKQTVLALLIGNVVAFPIRALRHQLPRYIGIFSPKMGTQLLLLGQGLRVGSLILVGGLYYWLF
ncbi:MAG: nucleoside recognition protein [Thermodesulfobacteriota bacterium]